MIKLLKNKMLIALFLLVIVITVTSSCYATSTYTYDDFDWSVDKTNNTLTVTNIPLQVTRTYEIDNDISGYSDYIVTFGDYVQYPDSYQEFYSFGIVFCNEYNWTKYIWRSVSSRSGYYYYLDTDDGVACFFNFSISTSGSVIFGVPWGSFGVTVANNVLDARGAYWCYLHYDTYNGSPVEGSGSEIVDTTFASITHPEDNSNIFVSSASTDFNYKFEAETKNRLALTITDLDSSYKMIGFVDNPTTYEVGDVLSAGIDIAYQRITPRRFR